MVILTELSSSPYEFTTFSRLLVYGSGWLESKGILVLTTLCIQELFLSSIEPIARLGISYDDFETLDLMIGYGFLLSY